MYNAPKTLTVAAGQEKKSECEIVHFRVLLPCVKPRLSSNHKMRININGKTSTALTVPRCRRHVVLCRSVILILLVATLV